MYETASYIHNQQGRPVTKLTMDEGVMTWNYTNVYAVIQFAEKIYGE